MFALVCKWLTDLSSTQTAKDKRQSRTCSTRLFLKFVISVPNIVQTLKLIGNPTIIFRFPMLMLFFQMPESVSQGFMARLHMCTVWAPERERETKQQPSRARRLSLLDCCLVSLSFRCQIQRAYPVWCSGTTFCWLPFGNFTMMPNFSANFARYAALLSHPGIQSNNKIRIII